GRLLASLARKWKVTSLEKHFTALAASYLTQLRDEKESDANRAAAANGIVELRGADPAVFQDLADFLSPRTSPATAKGVLEALGRSEIPGVGKEIATILPSLTPAVRPTAVRVLLTKPDWTR